MAAGRRRRSDCVAVVWRLSHHTTFRRFFSDCTKRSSYDTPPSSDAMPRGYHRDKSTYGSCAPAFTIPTHTPGGSYVRKHASALGPSVAFTRWCRVFSSTAKKAQFDKFITIKQATNANPLSRLQAEARGRQNSQCGHTLPHASISYFHGSPGRSGISRSETALAGCHS